MSADVLAPIVTPTSHNWRLRGNCIAINPDLMHPDLRDHAGEQEAKKVCRDCPVARQCLADSLRTRDFQGIRAGLTGGERRNLDPNNPARPCKRCRALFVPRLTTQVRCRPCARTADTRARRRDDTR